MNIEIKKYRKFIKICQYVSVLFLIPIFIDFEIGTISQEIIRNICLAVLIAIGLSGFLVAILLKCNVMKFINNGKPFDVKGINIIWGDRTNNVDK